MVKGQATIQIDRPPKDVFTYVTDLANFPRWQGEVIEAELLSEPPLRPGSHARGAGKLLGRRIELTIEVTVFEPGHKFAFKSITGPIKSENSFIFESADGGTRLTESSEGELAGFFGLAEPLVGRTINRQFETNLANLKDLLENGGAAA